MRGSMDTMKTTIELTPDEKQKLKMEAAREDRYMKDTGGEAIALYVNVPEELMDAVGADTKGEVISLAVDRLVEEHAIE